jgi:RimJ/RimL family protein N-acetyltransferase
LRRTGLDETQLMVSKTRKTGDGRGLLIREGAGADAKTILAYLEQVSTETDFLTFGPADLELSEAEEAAYLERCHRAENCPYLLAFVDGNLAGILSFSASSRPRIRHTGELAITVLQAYWGLGVASAVLDALLEWANDGGVIKKINLWVRTDNQRALALHERKGFEIEGTVRKEIFVDGIYYDNLLMGLVIP